MSAKDRPRGIPAAWLSIPRVPCCEDGHHEALRRLPAAAWELLPLVGAAWYPSEVESHEDLHQLRNCNRCHSTLSRIVDSRVKPWRRELPAFPMRPAIAADLDEVLP